MKTKNLHITKILAFLLVAALLFGGAAQVLRISDDTHSRAEFDTFYRLDKDSLDAVWIGASAVQSSFIPSEAYTHNGVQMYGLGTASQPVALTKYLLQEVQKTQDPKVYLIDIRMLAYDYDVMGNEIFCDNYIRRVTDSMRFSNNRTQAIKDMVERLEKKTGADVNAFDYYFSFTLYHNRWSQLTAADFGKDPDSFMGYYIYDETESFDKQETLARRSAKPLEVSSDNQQYLEELLDYLDTFDGRILFTNTPNNLEEDKFANYNYIKKEIESRGYEVLDLNDHVDEIGLDYETDFNENMHVNYRGAFKITDYMADYLKEKYELPDHKKATDSIYEKTQERLLSRIEEMEKHNE